MNLTWWLTPGVHEQPRHRMRRRTLGEVSVRLSASVDLFRLAAGAAAVSVAGFRTALANAVEVDSLDQRLRAVCRPEELADAEAVVSEVEARLRASDWPGDPAVIARKRVLAQVTRGEVPPC